MEFIVNQKLVSLTGKYFIKDKSGNDVFVVKGSFSLPRKFRVFDMQGKEIVCVKKRMFRLLERFDFYEGKAKVFRKTEVRLLRDGPQNRRLAIGS